MTEDEGRRRMARPPTAGDAAGRGVPKRLKTAKKHSASSQAWLERQINDPFAAEARAKGYRSRAAFKLIELDDKFHFLKPGTRVLDLGAAPGGWSQVVAKRVGAKGAVVAADILEIPPLPGVTVLQADIREPDAVRKLQKALGGPADVVLSDMAASTTGHRATDHLRTLALLEAALDTAAAVLKPGGAFVGKVFQGGATGELLAHIKKMFHEVRHVKPRASRAESVELYLVALGYRGEQG
jgi:23S rRNA (uridine2552-2'-O)-methyltransferase